MKPWDLRALASLLPALSLPHAYVVAIGAVLAAALLRGAIAAAVPDTTPFTLFYPAVALAALLGGVGPGAVAAALALAIAWYFFVPPYNSLAVDSLGNRVSLMLFAGAGALLVAMGSFLRASFAALRDNEARLRLAWDAVEDTIWDWDPVADRQRWSEAGAATFGWRDAVDAPQTAAWWAERVHPDDRERVSSGFHAALKDPARTHWRDEYRFACKDGRVAHVSDSGLIVRDGGGRPIRMVGAMRDVTDLKRSEAELAKSELGFRTLAQNMPPMAWMMDPAGHVYWYNDRWYDYAGLSFAEMEGWGWEKLHHPDHIERVRASKKQALASGAVWEDTFPLRRKDGAWRWFLTRAAPTRDAEGRILHWLGTNTDITEQRQTEERLRERERHLRLVVDELNHRVKNTLTVVQGVAQQTFAPGGVPAELRRAFEGRLRALASAHDILTREHWESADLRKLAAEVLHVDAAIRSRIAIDGPPVRLEPKAAVSVAMALHELGVNAAKHGALSNDAGRVTLNWKIVADGADRLLLRWQEEGGPPVTAPARRGFGSRMIERALAAELRGEARLRFDSAGLVCEIEAPAPVLSPTGGGARFQAL